MLPQVRFDTDQFRDLIEEYRTLIAGIYPEWTDYNYHDPGMTFLELFAWMKENQQFHMEQLGDAHYEAFFRLLGFEREGRRPAGILAMGKPEGEWSIPAGARFQTGGIIFETVEEETLTDALTEAVHVGKDGSPGETVDLKRPASMGEMHFYPLGKTPVPGDSCLFLYDRPLRPDTVYHLFLQMEKKQESLRNPRRPEDPFEALTEVRWSVYTEMGWEPADLFYDDTGSLLFGGRIGFSFQTPMAPLAEPWANGLAGKYALRAELYKHTYDLPPLVSGITMNLVSLAQKETWRTDGTPYVLAEGNGFPDQEYALPWKEPMAESVQLEVEDVLSPGSFVPWKRTGDISSCGPSDPCYQVDEDQGTVRFGDGFCGMPPEGRIRLLSMVETLGSRGNVTQGTRLMPEDTAQAKELFVYRTTAQGRDRETMEKALLRLGTERSSPVRAVTAADYEKVAMETPGLILYSAKVLPAPPHSNQVALVVRPGDGRRNLPLSEGYRINLLRYLDRRRLLGTRLKLVSPEYIELRLYLEVLVMPQFRQAESMIREAAVQWFSRLGASFGEPVSYGGLYGVIDSLPCVKRLRILELETSSTAVSRNHGGDLIPPENGVFLLKQIEYTSVND